MTTPTKQTPKMPLKVQEALHDVRRQLWLQASAWRGEAARAELMGADMCAPDVSAWRHCAGELDRLMSGLPDLSGK
jgi:hypothetical protein